ncbi:MAG TPA: NAD(P)/FAD-dependent oxidoreductase [Nocardioidaceae bacterium]|nr:NAD(P)/FAD-dependent oxidoreductase [Nocardioidaceae bacterium]
MARVVVVGGGFAGTASAARLAKLGHDVTLLERREVLGGAVGYVERDGFRWDAGPAGIALPAVLRDLWHTTGRPLERELELVSLDPVREHRFTDGSVLAMPSGRGAQAEAVGAVFGGKQARRWLDYVQGLAEPWDLLRRAMFEEPFVPESLDAPTRALLRSRTTLRRAVRSLSDRRLAEMAVLHAQMAGHDPRHVPAWAGLHAYVEQTFGCWTIPGGMGSLADALARRLEQRGVTVHLGTTAGDLVVREGSVAGVSIGEDVMDADVVVCAVDPRGLPALAGYVARTLPALPPVVCHLGLPGEVPALPREVVLHGDPLLVLRTDGRAPDGGAAWTILGRGKVDDLVDDLARRGINVRRQVEVRVDRSPRDIVESLHGSPCGVLWAGRRTFAERLGTATPIPNVFCAGAHPAGLSGLPYVGLTAAVVAAQVGKA